MMLRESSKTFGYETDLRAVTDPSVGSGIPNGDLLIGFVDAVLSDGDSSAHRASVVGQMGEEALVETAGVIGNFAMMNRIADATGMPVGKGSLAHTADVRELLGLDRFRHD